MLVAIFLPGPPLPRRRVSEKTVLYMMFPLLAKVFNSLAWAAQPLLVTEMMPTSLRNTAYGFIGFVGDVGSVLSPYLKRLVCLLAEKPLQETVHKKAPVAVIVGLSLVSSLLVLTAPETKDRPLPEDIPDFDEGPLLEWVNKKCRRSSPAESKSVEVRKGGNVTCRVPLWPLSVRRTRRTWRPRGKTTTTPHRPLRRNKKMVQR